MNSRNDKEKNALFVDLTNFYTQFIKSNLDVSYTPEHLRNYFMDWFDFSVLSTMLTKMFADIWIFYSGNRLGPKDARIDNQFLKNFIARINNQKGVTAYDVNIPGEQREPYKMRCDNCGTETEPILKSEKGIDSSLIVHLFDTMESWDKAYLLSGDADFVPAVRSLRRRGKIVNGAGFVSSASSALVRESFDFIDLRLFFLQDLAIYKLLRKDGLISDLFAQLKKQPLKDKHDSVIEREFDLDISLLNHFNSNKIILRITSSIIDFEKAEDKFQELPLLKNFYNDSFEIYFDDYLFGYISDKLKELSRILNLKLDKVDEDIDHEYYFYSTSFTWNKKASKYEQVCR